MKRILLLLPCFAAFAACAAVKPFTLEIKPGVTEYTVTAPESGTYWFQAHTVSKVPVGKQHFAELRWDNDLPMTRRLLQANQTEKTMTLDRVTFAAGQTRRLYFKFDPKTVTVDHLRFFQPKSGRVSPKIAAYRPPFDPPAAHPRVLVNPQYLAWLRKHLDTGENAPVWAQIRQAATVPYRFAPPRDRELQYDKDVVAAMRAKAFYYLVTGDEKIGREAAELARAYMTQVTFGNGQDICRKSGESIYSTALVYDWCYPLLSAAEKKLLRERMLYYAVEMEVGWPPFRQSVAAGHGNEAQISRDLLAMAIAVWNEDPVPYRYVMYQMLENFKPYKEFSYRSGRHSQGTGYGQFRGGWDLVAALQFRRTFGRELLPPEAAKFPYMWYYLRLPDGRFTPEGDANWTWKAAYAPMKTILLQCAVALYADPELKMELVRGNPKGRIEDPVFFLLTNDPGLKPEDRRAELPLMRLYADPLPGLYVRTGWNFGSNADDAVVTLQGAHTHFRNHQHRDLGSFQIYYRGNLASDLVQYQTYGVPYDSLLAKQSALHSLMRFVDSAAPGRGKGKLKVNTGTQHTEGLSPLNIRELQQEKYRCGETPRAGFGPDAKRPLYGFMEVDLGRLFPGRVKDYTRSFVFLNQSSSSRPGTLIVLDRFTTEKPEIKPIFQLASIERPEWKDGVLTVRSDMYGKTGVLTLTPLVPDKVAAEMFTGKDAHTFGGVYIPPRSSGKREANGTRTEFTGPGGVFLNALQIHGGEVSPLPVRYAANGTRYDVEIADYLVSLGAVRAPTRDAFKFTVPRDETKVLLLDLAPGKWRVGGRTFSVMEREGCVFAVFGKGVYEISPGAEGKPEAAPALQAVPTPPPARNELVLDGEPVPNVRTVVKEDGIFLPLADMVKDATGWWLLPPWEYALSERAIRICGYDFALPSAPGAKKLVPADLVGALLGRSAHLDELSGSVRFTPRRDHSGILHASASAEAENLRELLYQRKGSWITLGRDVTAEIVFANRRELAGLEFDLPYGKTRKQLLRIDLVSEGEPVTVFDGETDGASQTARIEFAPRRVRAVRLVMKGNSQHGWNSVDDIRFLSPAGRSVSDAEIEKARPVLFANLRKLLLEDTAPAQLNPIDVEKAAKKADVTKDLQPDGTWRDVDYRDRSRAVWKPRTHLLRMRELAVSHPELAKRALRAWAERDPQTPNWWNRFVGTPEAICQTLILLGGVDAVDPDVAARLHAIVTRSYDVHPKHGQNLVWLSAVRLMAGLLWNDPAAIRTGGELIRNELCVVPVGETGLQSDWSFHQHGIHLQIGNYGLGFFGNQILWMRAFAGTPLAYPQEKVALLDHYLMDCLRWTRWDGALEPNACGHMAVRYEMTVVRAQSLLRYAKQLAGLLPADRRAAVEAWLKDPTKLVGCAVFPHSGYLVYRAPAGWNFSLKMCSPELIGSETVGGLNLCALYQADGAVYFGDCARYRDLHILFDPYKQPGTTEIQDGRSLLGQVAPRNVGGYYAVLADFPTAVAAMRFAPGDVTADKVWFCTPSGVWCSGSDIGSDAKFPVVTTVDQFRAEGAPLAADVPAGFPAVASRTLDMTGDVHQVIRESPSRKMTARMTLMTIDHGVAPKQAVYRYRMRRAADPAKPETWLAASSPRIHALAAEGRVLVAAFTAGEVTLPDGKKLAVKPGAAIFDGAGKLLRQADFRVK